MKRNAKIFWSTLALLIVMVTVSTIMIRHSVSKSKEIVRSNPFYIMCADECALNPEVVEITGTPIEPAFPVEAWSQVEAEHQNEFVLRVRIAGPKGRGVMYASGIKIDGEWHYYEFTFEPQNAPDNKINILDGGRLKAYNPQTDNPLHADMIRIALNSDFFRANGIQESDIQAFPGSHLAAKDVHYAMLLIHYKDVILLLNAEAVYDESKGEWQYRKFQLVENNEDKTVVSDFLKDGIAAPFVSEELNPVDESED